MTQQLEKIINSVLELDLEAAHGISISSRVLEGDAPVAEVLVEGREELPIYLTISDTQLLCICYIASESEINADKRCEMMETMLEVNVPMPLSAFAKIDDRYAIFGAMSLSSTAEDIALELAYLSDNSMDAIDALDEYLV